jgi:NADPH:quinone reductase
VNGRRHLIELERFGGPEVMRWVAGEAPTPGPGQVAVLVEALGVNFADTMVRRGEYRRDQPLDFTPGFEVVGKVIESPAGGPAPGARVVVLCDNGRGYTDLLIAPVERAFELPDDVPANVAAALFVQGTTAWYALHRFGHLMAGETVLVHAGAGGVGSMAIQLAVAAGATAIATASSEAKLEIARGHGATHAFLANPETLTAQVREATGGSGVDVVVDGVSGPLVAPSLAALGFHGRYVVAGAASQEAGKIDTRVLMPRNQSIAGFVTARIIERDPAEPSRAIDAVFDAWRRGELRPTMTTMAPSEVVAAHELLESREHIGKIVLDVAGNPIGEGS